MKKMRHVKIIFLTFVVNVCLVLCKTPSFIEVIDPDSENDILMKPSVIDKIISSIKKRKKLSNRNGESEYDYTYDQANSDLPTNDLASIFPDEVNNQDPRMLRKFRYEFIMAFWVKYSANLDSLGQLWEDFKSRVTNYGCFCFNNQSFAKGRGKARDLIDQSCKNLYKCQTCIGMDINNKLVLPNLDGTCELTSSYSFNLTRNEVTTNAEIECLNLEGTCKRALCECDKRFAFELANSYDTWDSRYKGKDTFDRQAVCKSNGASHLGQIDKCCGIYPYRYPYHSNDGMRSCCGVKTFDTMGIKRCCSDQVLRDSCPEDVLF